ncbi:DEAD/DEAH box helicase [Flavobacteriales bacterium]|nr:DEAD/DEAH box helicase [Flavobacteriales bacterium]MDB4088323.1 DEAD/DEAH box helicase [Flavobacteriales bacterium]
MQTFHDFNVSKYLLNGLEDMDITIPTPIQSETYNVIRSGRNVVGIAQTGTGKTLAYSLPILNELKYSEQKHPKVLILVPTRELVLQVVENLKDYSKYVSLRILGVYGGTNINTQKAAVAQGQDVIVATPGRLYDLVMHRSLSLKSIQKLVIDEVDVMLDLGFRFQLTNIFELLPDKRQNTMFSATMTDEIQDLIEAFFISPITVSIALSGTPLENIKQVSYPVQNFYTKANLLEHLLKDKDQFKKVLIFVSSKTNADRLFNAMEERFGKELGVVHSNKSQNYRIKSIKRFDEGLNRILISTDVMARGLDLDAISHVINLDTPNYPENYMHRIGRTGRAEKKGNSIILYTEKEAKDKEKIEVLMGTPIEKKKFPESVSISNDLIPEERPKAKELNIHAKKDDTVGASFHEKSKKNQMTNGGNPRLRRKNLKYKKPQKRGDQNLIRRKPKKGDGR